MLHCSNRNHDANSRPSFHQQPLITCRPSRSPPQIQYSRSSDLSLRCPTSEESTLMTKLSRHQLDKSLQLGSLKISLDFTLLPRLYTERPSHNRHSQSPGHLPCSTKTTACKPLLNLTITGLYSIKNHKPSYVITTSQISSFADQTQELYPLRPDLTARYHYLTLPNLKPAPSTLSSPGPPTTRATFSEPTTELPYRISPKRRSKPLDLNHTRNSTEPAGSPSPGLSLA